MVQASKSDWSVTEASVGSGISELEERFDYGSVMNTDPKRDWRSMNSEQLEAAVLDTPSRTYFCCSQKYCFTFTEHNDGMV
jgi:hypothetical protein